MNRTIASLLACLTLGAGPGSVMAQGTGLSASDSAWSLPRLQARVGLLSAPIVDGQSTPWQQPAGVVLGDYYFSRVRLGSSDVSSGFRATSGLLLGQRSLALGTPALASNAPGLSLTLSRQARVAMPAAEGAAEPWSAVPYLGVGWTGSSLRGGWGVTADFGFAARSGTGLRVGSTQGLDELLRELRLMPVLHLGVSYAF